MCVIVNAAGGPGSRKGCVVEELVASYGFTFVSGENLIQQELPRKLANIVKLETVKDVRTLLEVRPENRQSTLNIQSPKRTGP